MEGDGSSDVVDLESSDVPVGIDQDASSGMLKAALADDAAKAALLGSLRASATTQAGTEAQAASQETTLTLKSVESSLEKARIEKDVTKIGKLEAQAKDLQDLAEEQLQDGNMAAVAAADVKTLSDKAMTNGKLYFFSLCPFLLQKNYN